MKTRTKSKNHQKKHEKSKLIHQIDSIIIASFPFELTNLNFFPKYFQIIYLTFIKIPFIISPLNLLFPYI